MENNFFEKQKMNFDAIFLCLSTRDFKMLIKKTEIFFHKAKFIFNIV